MSERSGVNKPVDLTVDKRAREFRVEWASGERSVFGFDYLSAHCPCANCKERRKEIEKNPLHVLSGPTGSSELENAEMVGRYAINFIWKGGCGAGIYSFDYLYDIDPGRAQSASEAKEEFRHAERDGSARSR